MLDRGQIIDIFRDALLTGISVIAVPLVAAMLIGVVIAVLQAASQVNEQTLTFVPKLLVIAVLLIVMSPWMMEQMEALFERLMNTMAAYL